MKDGLQRLGELGKERADRDGFKTDAEVRGQLLAVVDGTRGRIGAGHADADHVLPAEGLGSDGGHQSGVDAAAQTHNGLAEAAFAHVIACAKHQGAISGLSIIVFRNRDWRGVEGIDENQILDERSGLCNQLAAPIEREGGAVKDQAVVAAHLIAHQHRNAVAAGHGGQHLAADGALGVPERRRGKVDVQGGLLAHQLFHGIDGVEAARPEVLIVPRVFADGDGKAHAVQLDHLLRFGWRKVPLLVENVVERQEPFVLLKEQLSLVEEDCGVEGRLSILSVCRKCDAGENRDG